MTDEHSADTAPVNVKEIEALIGRLRDSLGEASIATKLNALVNVTGDVLCAEKDAFKLGARVAQVLRDVLIDHTLAHEDGVAPPSVPRIGIGVAEILTLRCAHCTFTTHDPEAFVGHMIELGHGMSKGAQRGVIESGLAQEMAAKLAEIQRTRTPHPNARPMGADESFGDDRVEASYAAQQRRYDHELSHHIYERIRVLLAMEYDDASVNARLYAMLRLVASAIANTRDSAMALQRITEALGRFTQEELMRGGPDEDDDTDTSSETRSS